MDDSTKLWFELITENERLKRALDVLKYMLTEEQNRKKKEEIKYISLDEEEINIVLRIAGMLTGESDALLFS